jgi:hypothetical protein
VVVGLARPGAGGVRSWRLPAALVLVIAALTQVVFPIAYDGITAQQAGPSLVLVLRNVLLLALLAGHRPGRGGAPQRTCGMTSEAISSRWSRSCRSSTCR